MQDWKQSVTIPLPNLGASNLCPIRAIKNMIQLFPCATSNPWFVILRTSNIVPLTDSVARKHLKKISNGFSPPPFLHPPDFSCCQESWCHVKFPPRCASGAHYETWHLEIRCCLGISLILPFHCFSRNLYFSTVTTFLVLLGLWVNSSF